MREYVEDKANHLMNSSKIAFTYKNENGNKPHKCLKTIKIKQESESRERERYLERRKPWKCKQETGKAVKQVDEMQ